MTDTPVTKSKRKSNKIPMLGKKFGRWTVLKEAGQKQRAFKYTCICACGTIGIVAGVSLRNGHSKSCGCLTKKEMIGKLFGRWTIVREVKNIHKRRMYQCLCKCGTIKIIEGGSLRAGTSRSCGCLRLETSTKHGKMNTPEYGSWEAMNQRCNNQNHTVYKHYGGRGISICKEWSDFSIFLKDMGKKPEGYTIERKNNELGYFKENCCWIPQSQQVYNQRLHKKNKTGVAGVWFNKKSQRYIAQISKKNKINYIGSFKTIEQATIARKEAEQKFWRK